MIQAEHLQARPQGESPRAFSGDLSPACSALRRCSDSAFQAACHYANTRDAKWVSAIVAGIIERYADQSTRSQARTPSDKLRLAEDLGIDSLTMIEIALQAEGIFQIEIDHDELRSLQTVGDVRAFIDQKLGLPPTSGTSEQTAP